MAEDAFVVSGDAFRQIAACHGLQHPGDILQAVGRDFGEAVEPFCQLAFETFLAIDRNAPGEVALLGGGNDAGYFLLCIDLGGSVAPFADGTQPFAVRPAHRAGGDAQMTAPQGKSGFMGGIERGQQAGLMRRLGMEKVDVLADETLRIEIRHFLADDRGGVFENGLHGRVGIDDLPLHVGNHDPRADVIEGHLDALGAFGRTMVFRNLKAQAGLHGLQALQDAPRFVVAGDIDPGSEVAAGNGAEGFQGGLQGAIDEAAHQPVDDGQKKYRHQQESQGQLDLHLSCDGIELVAVGSPGDDPVPDRKLFISDDFFPREGLTEFRVFPGIADQTLFLFQHFPDEFVPVIVAGGQKIRSFLGRMHEQRAVILAGTGIERIEITGFADLVGENLFLQRSHFGRGIDPDEVGPDHAAIRIPDRRVAGVVVLAEHLDEAGIGLTSQQFQSGGVLGSQRRARCPLAVFLSQGGRQSREILAVANEDGRIGFCQAEQLINFGGAAM